MVKIGVSLLTYTWCQRIPTLYIYIYIYIHIMFVTFVLIFKFILIYLLHVLFVLKNEGIFGKKSPTPMC